MMSKFNKISIKLLVVLILCGLVPLVLFGVYSIQKAKQTSIDTVLIANQEIANQVAGRMSQYLQNFITIQQALSENLETLKLSHVHNQKVLRSYSFKFDEINAINLFDLQGKLVMSSEIMAPDLKPTEYISNVIKGDLHISEVYQSEDLTPTITLALPVKHLGNTTGILAVELDLFHLWQLISKIRIGKNGYLNLLTPKGKIFASGNGYYKKLAINMTNYPHIELLSAAQNKVFEANTQNKSHLIVFSTLPKPFNWTVTVELPSTEAYALSNKMRTNLVYGIIILLFVVLLTSLVLSRQIILDPIGKIMQRIREISKGRLEGKIILKNKDEFALLAETLNNMSDKIIESQKSLIRKEKQALLGRVASQLVHDLKHPVQSIENYTTLLIEQPEKEEYRVLGRSVLKNELNKINFFLDSLHDLAADIPHYPSKQQLHPLINNVVNSLVPEMHQKNIQLVHETEQDLSMQIDLISFQRMLTNFLKNAIEAMPEGGELSVKLFSDLKNTKNKKTIEIRDTGIGIPEDKIEDLFLDYTSSKNSGLGLGMAIAKKIIEQHGGDVRVASKVGNGTVFTLNFP
jgi:signal transduction histidine kinase